MFIDVLDDAKACINSPGFRICPTISGQLYVSPGAKDRANMNLVSAASIPMLTVAVIAPPLVFASLKLSMMVTILVDV
jgi:hypothetical protein